MQVREVLGQELIALILTEDGSFSLHSEFDLTVSCHMSFANFPFCAENLVYLFESGSVMRLKGKAPPQHVLKHSRESLRDARNFSLHHFETNRSHLEAFPGLVAGEHFQESACEAPRVCLRGNAAKLLWVESLR